MLDFVIDKIFVLFGRRVFNRLLVVQWYLDDFTIYIGLPIVCTMVHSSVCWACVAHYFSLLYCVVCLPFICLRPVLSVPCVANVSGLYIHDCTLAFL